MSDNLVTYTIKKMRVIRTSGKMAEKHPERIFTVHGEFYKDNAKLSFTSKVIEISDVQNPAFSIDLDKGILTLNENSKGRKKMESISQEDILAELEAIRGA